MDSTLDSGLVAS